MEQVRENIGATINRAREVVSSSIRSIEVRVVFTGALIGVAGTVLGRTGVFPKNNIELIGFTALAFGFSVSTWMHQGYSEVSIPNQKDAQDRSQTVEDLRVLESQESTTAVDAQNARLIRGRLDRLGYILPENFRDEQMRAHLYKLLGLFLTGAGAAPTISMFIK